MASAVMMAMTVLSSDIQALHFSRIFVKRDGQNILKCLNTTSSGFNFNHNDLFKRQSPTTFHGHQKRNSRFRFKPLASSGLEAFIADPKESSITLKNAKIVVESQDENTMQVRVDLTGDETQKVFDHVLKNLARSALPILGFCRQRGGSGKLLSTNHGGIYYENIQGSVLRCSYSVFTIRASGVREYRDPSISMKRRNMIGLVLGASSFFLHSIDVKGVGLPLEEKPKLCDDACEKELENVPMVTTESGLQYKDIKVGAGPSPPIGFQVAANYVAMVPSGQIFDSSLEKGQLYLFRVGSGQVIKGLDEGILSMKAGGKRRLYIPGNLAFPKGLNAAPGRPRVGPNSPVIFDVSLEYIPGLEFDEE